MADRAPHAGAGRPCHARRPAGRGACFALGLLAWLIAGPLAADTVRIATFNAELQRDGPGLLLRDIDRGEDKQIAAVIDMIAVAAPDILALQSIDWDHDGLTLAAFTARLADAGIDYPHTFFPRGNRGLPSGADLDGDGRPGEPEDMQGFGAFTGQGAMAILSRFPILADRAQVFDALLWRDLPGADLPVHPDGSPFPSSEALQVQRLSSSGHWAVPVELPGGQVLTVLTFHAAPPVFDGPEDRNGRRNADEIRFWPLWLDGAFGPLPPGLPVVAGDTNQDPAEGEGRKAAIQALLADPRLQDPFAGATGDLATVEWDGIGRFRVDYVLPSADLSVVDAGILRPGAQGIGEGASRHALVWVDLHFP
ncbi:endonuclease/exonuclease/phosphatase family protein [Chachezhania sediminis]|uniref:endonuclease/exonuclease/phosphatase family protein n=1 Tax=Chachezhania sediminis TaxID=2599291 RepID=UPI00131A8863|nr:endonuclease/exonuclease/phosphatase family protein [Chachezhania sediminis]